MPLGIVWLVLMVGAFYLLLWRPQQRRIADGARACRAEIQEGDEVLTTSGIYGRIARLGEADAELEIAPGTVIRVARGAIGQVARAEPDESLDAPTARPRRPD